MFGSFAPIREEQFHPLTGNGIGTAAARAMRIVMILVLFVHRNQRGKHLRTTDGEWGLTVKATQIKHGNTLSWIVLVPPDSTPNFSTLRIKFRQIFLFALAGILQRPAGADFLLIGDEFTHDMHPSALV